MIAPATRLAIRVAAWVALAVVIAIAFRYAKKYESDMLTDHFQTTVTLPDTPRPTPVTFDQKPQSSPNGGYHECRDPRLSEGSRRGFKCEELAHG